MATKLRFKHISTLLLTLTLLTISFMPDNVDYTATTDALLDKNCQGIHRHSLTKRQKCSYVRSNPGCNPNGYIPYLRLLYCNFGTPFLAFLSFFIWLVVLFYLLADTANNYFCHALSGLSKCLRLSPVLSGVSLLSLGNGAPDIFSSVAAFTGDGTVDIGLNSTLGAGFFVSCVVFGVVSICVDESCVRVCRKGFVVNVVFLLISIACVLVVVAIGHAGLVDVILFLCFYVAYVLVTIFFVVGEANGDIIGSLIIDGVNSPLLDHQIVNKEGKVSKCFDTILWVLELPFDLPRRMTIPVVSTDKWSKAYAILAATFFPQILLTLFCHFNSTKSRVLAYVISGSIGVSCGILLFITSDKLNPPTKFVALWLLEGFAMSVTWTYFLAQELVSLLVSLSLLLGISHSLVGLTVLAWGNSVGDMVANVAMAKNGGPDGVHVAASGCFAGPLFNTLVGLGLSLGLSCWKSYPSEYPNLPAGYSVFVTAGFFVLGLIWSFVVVLKGNLRIGKGLGCGLIAIYLCFLFVQIFMSLGVESHVNIPFQE